MKILKIVLTLIFVISISHVDAQTVYTTKTGEKYHKESCKYLKYSKKEITLEKALELGYTSCLVCKPSSEINSSQKSSNLSSSTNNPPSTTTKSTTIKSTATQCTGKTQSGTRCKRMTKSANNRCYQH